MHQRFAIDYLNPAELVQLYDQLAGPTISWLVEPMKPDASF